MRARNLRLGTTALVTTAALCLVTLEIGLSSIWADKGKPGADALEGQVTSAQEGRMEGVLVTAKETGSTIAVTVVSDNQGRYRFPASRLQPGHYGIGIRAVGYDLESPVSVDVSSAKAASADLKLRPAADISSQLTNAEWLVSFPGTDEQKASIQACTHCHTLQPIVRSHHDAAQFEQVLERMSHYTPESFPLMIQRHAGDREGGGELSTGAQAQQKETRRKQAAYLASINLSASTHWKYPLKTFPRPAGAATRVIITEYNLPKLTRQPHDVIVDKQGMVWYAAFGEPILGKLDPKTGKVTEYPVPVLKPHEVIGTLDLEFDEDQNLWLAMTFQAAVAKFDRATEKFQVFRLPPELDASYRELTFVSPTHSHVDGKVWINDSGTYTQLRLDIATGKFEVFEPYPTPRPNIYDILSDSENNGYFTVMGREDIGRIDAKTGKIAIYPTPTLKSAPRRGAMDSQDRLWFGENRANRIGMFDTRSHKFREWISPTPDYFPYDVAPDKNGEAWAGTEFADRVERLNPTTGKFIEYLLPRETNMRRSFVDNSTTPVTFWVGNTHGASIVRVEPLE